jgi:hypothetical protein
MEILGAKLPTYMIGRNNTRWTVAELNEDEWERLRWVFRVLTSFKLGPYPWDDVTLRAWFMGMNPRLGDDDHNNPAMFIREGRGEEVLRAAKGDYFDGSMGA